MVRKVGGEVGSGVGGGWCGGWEARWGQEWEVAGAEGGRRGGVRSGREVEWGEEQEVGWGEAAEWCVWLVEGCLCRDWQLYAIKLSLHRRQPGHKLVRLPGVAHRRARPRRFRRLCFGWSKDRALACAQACFRLGERLDVEAVLLIDPKQTGRDGRACPGDDRGGALIRRNRAVHVNRRGRASRGDRRPRHCSGRCGPVVAM